MKTKSRRKTAYAVLAALASAVRRIRADGEGGAAGGSAALAAARPVARRHLRGAGRVKRYRGSLEHWFT